MVTYLPKISHRNLALDNYGRNSLERTYQASVEGLIKSSANKMLPSIREKGWWL